MDHRADLYSFGVMLFEMLTGTKPFLGETNARLLIQHIAEPPPSMDQVAPEARLSASLEALVARLLSKAPAARFPSALEVHDALAAIEAELGLAPRPSGPMAAPRLSGPMAVAAHAAPLPRHSGPMGVTAPAALASNRASGPMATAAPAASPPRPTGPMATATRAPPPPRPTGPMAAPAPTALFATPERRRQQILIGAIVGGVVLLIALVIGITAGGGSRSGDAEAGGGRVPAPRLRQIEALLATGKVDEALREIRLLVARYPKDGRAYLLEAHACLAKKRTLECLASFELAVRLVPESRGDPRLVELLYSLLTHRRSVAKINAAHQGAALEFVRRHYRDATGIDAGAAQMLTRYVNEWPDPEPIWEIIGILRHHGNDKGVTYVHAFRQRLSSKKPCLDRLLVIREMVARRQADVIPLLQEVIRSRSFRSPTGGYFVDNRCLHEAARKAILELGGKPSDVPAAPRRSGGSGSGIERTLRRIFR